MALYPVRIVPKNDFDDATLSVSATELAGREVANTQNTRRDKFLRTVDASAFAITFVLPATRTLSHFSMWNHLNHAGNWRLQLYTDAGATSAASPFSDSGAISALSYTPSAAYTFSDGDADPFRSRHGSWMWFSPTAARSGKITFSGTPAQAWWQVGRFFLGRYYEFSYPVEWGSSRGLGDLSEGVRTEAGSLVTNLGECWPIVDFETRHVPTTHVAALLNILEYGLTARDVVVSPRVGEGGDDEAKHCVNGRLERLNEIGRTSVNRSSTRFRIVGN